MKYLTKFTVHETSSICPTSEEFISPFLPNFESTINDENSDVFDGEKENDSENEIENQDEPENPAVPVVTTPKQLKKSKTRERTKGKKSFREELIDLQKEQLKAHENQNQTTEKIFEEMFETQLKYDEKEREKERKFLLELGKIFASPQNNTEK